jgi:hypothetical protein
MSKLQFYHLFMVMATSLAIVTARPLLSTITATNVSAIELAESYQSVKILLDFLPLAERGVIIQTPTQTIGPENAKEIRSQLESRLSIYEVAIQQRGYKTISGQYRAEAPSPSCDRIGV